MCLRPLSCWDFCFESRQLYGSPCHSARSESLYRLLYRTPLTLDGLVAIICAKNTHINKTANVRFTCGPGSVVGIATAYGLDGPGIESRWQRDFPHQSRPALRPTQPPVQWVPGLSRGGKVLPGRDAEPSPSSSAEV